MTHVEFRLLDCAFQGPLSIQVFDDAPVSMSAQRAGVRRYAFIEKSPHLVNQSIGKVGVCSLVDALVELRAMRIERHDSHSRREVRRRRPQRSLTGNLLAGLQIKFNSALYPGPVA